MSKKSCDCEACQRGIDHVKKKDQEMLEKFGWVIHCVLNDKTCPYNTNFHTHGFIENFNHLDFQICFPIESTTAFAILKTIVDRIQTKEKFISGTIDYGILKNFAVTFFEVKDDNRKVLRIILPDDKGKFKQDEISSAYKDQWNV